MKTFKNGKIVEAYQTNANILGYQINMSSWQRGQKSIESKNGPNVLSHQEDDDERAGGGRHKKFKTTSKAKILEEFQNSINITNRP